MLELEVQVVDGQGALAVTSPERAPLPASRAFQMVWVALALPPLRWEMVPRAARQQLDSHSRRPSWLASMEVLWLLLGGCPEGADQGPMLTTEPMAAVTTPPGPEVRAVSAALLYAQA